MAFGDDAPAQKTVIHTIGQDLSLLSVGELDPRIAVLRAEIERIEADRRGKEASRSAADAFFRR